MTSIVAEEYCGTPLKQKHVFILQNDRLVKFKNGRKRHYGFGLFFNEVFFPEGYPHSVSKDYLSYQIFDTIQAFCSSVNGTIATQSIMQGLGVGAEATTALAATMTWVLKDGVGMIGRIVFAWAQGTDLDCDLKRWRLRADILNDVSMFLDVCSSNFGGYFVHIVCASALLKAIVVIAGLGTRPAIIQHQARRNNIGDVAAKDSSQETLVNLAALVTSLVIMPIIATSKWMSWFAFFLLAAVHIVANYCAVRSLSLETFNTARFHVAVKAFLNSGGTNVPSVRQVNLQEPVVLNLPRRWVLSIGSRLPKGKLTSQDCATLKDIYEKELYTLFVDNEKGRICVFLAPLASQDDVIRAGFEAETIGYRLTERKYANMATFDLMRDVRSELPELYGRFCKLARAEGWDFTRNYLGVKEWKSFTERYNKEVAKSLDLKVGYTVLKIRLVPGGGQLPVVNMGHGVDSVEIAITDGSDVEALNEPPSTEVENLEIEMGKIIAEEICGEESSKNKTVFTLTDGKIVAMKNEKRGSLAIRNAFYAIFLPEGFPASVSDDYATFQIFNTVADFCSGVMGTIATQSIMQGLGVGATATTALAATMTLILKDGIGMIGRIVFAWAKGTNLDYELKRWKMRADLLNNLAIFLEVISPLAGTNFLYVVCFSALLRAVIGVTVAGIKPAILQHQAQRNNIGDVAAHNSSQETLAAIAALIISLCVMPLLTLSPWLSWSVFVFLVALHLVANYCGLRSLFFRTFNPVRFHIAVKSFLQSGKTSVPSLRDVNVKEPILATFPRKWHISVGDPMPKKVLSTENLSVIRMLYEDEPYVLYLDKHSHRLHVILTSRADQEDILKGVFEAEYILSLLKESSEDPKSTLTIMQQCHADINNMFESFKQLAELQGWTFRHASMGIREYRVNWRNTSVVNGDAAHVKAS